MVKIAVIVDSENEWFNPKSPYFLGENIDYRKRMKKLTDFLRKKKIPIVFTRHIEPEESPTLTESASNCCEPAFQKGTNGIELISELSRRPEEPVVTKVRSISPFYKTGLEKTLKKLKADRLLVAGILTNLCVRSTVADAWDREYKITIVKDCCLSDSEKTDKAVFEDIKNTRPDVQLVALKNLKA